LWHRWYQPDGWQAWERLAEGITSDPSACSWGPGRIDLFARGAGGELMHGWWDGGAWSFAP
ncbi:MAG: hypothetical protein M3O78_07720, partial [Chloroflexota bacterium]|nr:hypothetical protein [Chloroflexota bacterium]